MYVIIMSKAFFTGPFWIHESQEKEKHIRGIYLLRLETTKERRRTEATETSETTETSLRQTAGRLCMDRNRRYKRTGNQTETANTIKWNHRENYKNQNEEHKPLKVEQGEPLTAKVNLFSF